MKIRNGFVSNSSSSSFVVIGTSALSIPGRLSSREFNSADELNVPEDFGGNTEFGWDEIQYDDFGSRLNFAYLQTEHRPEWLELLEDILREIYKVKTINWNITTSYDKIPGKVWGYIDHQSHADEGKNTEIFNSRHDLVHFLFAEDSYIQGDNDNK
jgi:hypothetical protein